MRGPYGLSAAAVVLGLAAAPVAAQFPSNQPGVGGPAAAPGFSPYLNLTRRGAGPAINYFGLVRPQQQTAASVQQLQTQANAPNPFAVAAAGDQPVVTGNPYGFQNYRAYFQNQYAAGGFGAGGAGGFQGAGVGPNPFAQMQPGAGRAAPAPRRR